MRFKLLPDGLPYCFQRLIQLESLVEIVAPDVKFREFALYDRHRAIEASSFSNALRRQRRIFFRFAEDGKNVRNVAYQVLPALRRNDGVKFQKQRSKSLHADDLRIRGHGLCKAPNG